MTMISHAGAPAPRTPGEVWAEARPNVLRWLVELAADRAQAAGDAERAAYGLVVERLPWGHRRVYDPRVPAILDAARGRALTSGTPVDAAVAFAALADIARTRSGTGDSPRTRTLPGPVQGVAAAGSHPAPTEVPPVRRSTVYAATATRERVS